LSFGRLFGSCDSYSQNAVFSFADRIYLLRRERGLKFSPALPCKKSAIKVSPAASRVIAGRFKRNGRTGSMARSDPAAVLFSREELNVETAKAWAAVNEIVAADRLLALARSEKGSPSCRHSSAANLQTCAAARAGRSHAFLPRDAAPPIRIVSLS
jgi:hypothetical protein